MNDLRRLETELEGLLNRMSRPARRKLAVEIARSLRSGQSKRIAAQRNPDGSAYAARATPKPEWSEKRKRKGRVRKMFQKLKSARFLKMKSTSEAAEVGFDGKVRRLAWEHHQGGRARDGVTLPRRRLLGITGLERDQITEMIIHHLAAD